MEDFARQLNVTPKYLSVILKDTMNKRPSEIIQMFTIKIIKYRLRFSKKSIQDIALELNFANASFFGKYVKEHIGMSPLEYRRFFDKQE